MVLFLIFAVYNMLFPGFSHRVTICWLWLFL